MNFQYLKTRKSIVFWIFIYILKNAGVTDNPYAGFDTALKFAPFIYNVKILHFSYERKLLQNYETIKSFSSKFLIIFQYK